MRADVWPPWCIDRDNFGSCAIQHRGRQQAAPHSVRKPLVLRRALSSLRRRIHIICLPSSGYIEHSHHLVRSTSLVSCYGTVILPEA